MASKVVRIRDDALAVAEQYSSDVSTAILIMHATLQEQSKHTFDKKTLNKLISTVVSETLAEHRGGY